VRSGVRGRVGRGGGFYSWGGATVVLRGGSDAQPASEGRRHRGGVGVT
jgi:hypothetical protein